jgi:hypothetical protein
MSCYKRWRRRSAQRGMQRLQVVMRMPAALSQLALILWLLAKGFNERRVRSIEALKQLLSGT